jgi:hypothetical protein
LMNVPDEVFIWLAPNPQLQFQLECIESEQKGNHRQSGMHRVLVEKKKCLLTQLVCVYCVCVCVLFLSHTPKAKTQNLFFPLGVDGNIICRRDRWWVYWLLIVYTLLLPWQFFTLIYIYFQKCWNLFYLFPK